MRNNLSNSHIFENLQDSLWVNIRSLSKLIYYYPLIEMKTNASDRRFVVMGDNSLINIQGIFINILEIVNI